MKQETTINRKLLRVKYCKVQVYLMCKFLLLLHSNGWFPLAHKHKHKSNMYRLRNVLLSITWYHKITIWHQLPKCVTTSYEVSKSTTRLYNGHKAEGTNKWLLLIYLDQQIYLETSKLLGLTAFLLKKHCII